MHPSLLLLSLTLILPLSAASSPPLHHHHNAIPKPLRQYIEVTRPLPFDSLTPSCLLSPTNATYSSPTNCSWTNAVLHFSAASNGTQPGHIAAVWLSGAELLRTSTPKTTPNGIFWSLRKDITRYTSLLRQSNLTLSVTGISDDVNITFLYYDVNITFLYYDVNTTDPATNVNVNVNIPLLSLLRRPDHKSDENSKSLELNENPADLIIPISSNSSRDDQGLWFKISQESDSFSHGIKIPSNTYRAVIELYISSHKNDEYWYTNPPDYYIEMNNLTTERGHGAYREVVVNLDNNVVGSVIPFPIIFSGGIDPLFWEPLVSIGAFDLPSYELELTPFLGMLLDGNLHFLKLEVANALPYWLVGANIHLWLDRNSDKVEAGAIKHTDPTSSVERESRFHQLDGKFTTEGRRKTELSGWVNSSAGNFTTHVSSRVDFENKIVFKHNGTSKTVKQEVKVMEKVQVRSSELGYPVSNMARERRYPLKLTTTAMPGSERDTFLISAELEHSMKELKKERGDRRSKFENRQRSRGWMFVKDGDILSGAAATTQSCYVKDSYGCYTRRVAAENGEIKNDTRSFLCAPPPSF